MLDKFKVPGIIRYNFGYREIDMDAKLIIHMDGKKTRVSNSKVNCGGDRPTNINNVNFAPNESF